MVIVKTNMAKGKSSSKKERERKKREEEERRKRELEASQVALDENQDKQKESSADDDYIRQQEVIEIREKQRQITKEKIAALATCIAEMKRQQWDDKIWDRYISCDERPSLEDPRELNAYISRWMDMDTDEPEELLVQCDYATELVEEIEEMLRDLRHCHSKRLVACYRAKLDLERAVTEKVDCATLKLLKKTSLNTDPETGNAYYFGQNNLLKLALWSNLSCNSRYNGTSSKELLVSISIPRNVVMTECAVRIMKTKTDQFSRLCYSYMPVEMSAFHNFDMAQSVELLQKPQVSEELLLYEDEGAVDLNEYFTVGSTISIDLLSIPPQPHTVKQWIITKVLEPDVLTYIPWTSDYAPASASDNPANDTKKEEEDLEKEQQQVVEELKRLIQISIMIPEDILWLDVPKLALWDPVGNIWTSTGLYNVVHKEDQNMLTFYAHRFGTFAFMQSRFGAFPYHSWSLTPLDSGKIMLTVATISFTVEIIIMKNLCVINQVQSSEKLYLEVLYGQQLSPAQLFKNLQAYGIYFTPNVRDYLFTTNVKQKDRTLEMNIYHQMAMCSTTVSFVYSRWNAIVGRDNFVIRVQRPEDTVDKGKQPVILISQTEATVLGITELSQSFSEAPSVDNQIAADLYHAVKYFDSSDDSIPEVDPMLIETVFQVISTCGILFC